MHINAIAGLAIAPILLSACGTGTNPFDPETLTVQAGFVTPAADGTYATSIDDPLGSAVIASGGNGYSYEVGAINASNTLVARAGIVPGTSVSSPLTTGSAQLTGVYNVYTILNGQIENDVVVGDSLFQANLIQLTADFGQSSLKGDAAGLEVDGSFSSGPLTGTVTFNGVTGNLTGVVGADEAVGAFQGSTSNGVMAGGFRVTENAAATN